MYHTASTTAPGGRIHVGNGKFVDADGKSLEIEDRLPMIDAEIARLEAMKAAIKEAKEAELAKFPATPEKPYEEWEMPALIAEYVKSKVDANPKAPKPVIIAFLRARDEAAKGEAK